MCRKRPDLSASSADRAKIARAQPEVGLDEVQRHVLKLLLPRINQSDASVVVTNPLKPNNPIVHVSAKWQPMCGFKYEQAVGQNPRIVQGKNTDPEAVRAISESLRNRSACKVQLLNYRGGDERQPFWNIISINPVCWRGELVFYMANLQDYTNHLSKLVSLSPSQFCRAALHYQKVRRLSMLEMCGDERNHAARHALARAKPAVYEVDEEHAAGGPEVESKTPPMPVIRRLGWSGLTLDPEHLCDRLQDALQGIGAVFEASVNADDEHEVFMLHVTRGEVEWQLSVHEESVGIGGEGTYRIASTRLAGPTHAYHEAFRLLRDKLGDACSHVLPGAAQPAVPIRPAFGFGLALAPMPTDAPPMQPPLLAPPDSQGSSS